MRLSQPILAAATAVATVAATAGVMAATATPAAAASLLPAHVFTPYFEAYSGDSLATSAANSGNKFMTMAFVQTASAGSCTVTWDGNTSTPISSSVFGNDINTIRASGGDVI